MHIHNGLPANSFSRFFQTEREPWDYTHVDQMILYHLKSIIKKCEGITTLVEVSMGAVLGRSNLFLSIKNIFVLVQFFFLFLSKDYFCHDVSDIMCEQQDHQSF